MRSRLGALALAGLAWALAQPAAVARPSDDLRASMRAGWTDGVDKGWRPIHVLLENRRDRPRRVRLVLTDSTRTARVERSLELDAHATVEAELLAPAWASRGSAWSLQVSSGGEVQFLSVGSWNMRASGLSTVLVTGASVPTSWSAAGWTEALSTRATGAKRPSFGRTRTVATPAKDNVRFAVATFDELATRWDAYSCLDLVLLETRAGLPEPPRLDALLAWTRSGGSLVLFGAGAAREARANPSIAPWLEERFRVEVEEGVDGYAFGHGTLRIADGEHAVDEEPLSETVHAVVFSNRGMVPDRHGWRLYGGVPDLPDVGAVPYKAFMLLLMAFAVVIGPVNLLCIKRWKRPALLLATIPAVALSTAVLFLLYGLFSQGIDVRTASRTFTVLDQRTHRASTAEVRTLFAGLAPGDLRPGPGTSCFVLPPPSPPGPGLGMSVHRAGAAGWSHGMLRFRIEQGAELRLSGDFLPARRLVRQVLLTDCAARARLEWSWEDDGPRVANGFETTLQTLVAREAGDRWFALDEAVPPGATAVLRPLPEEEALALQAELWGRAAVESGRPLFDGAYLARLADQGFGDDCGVDAREVHGEHVVLGILDGEAPFGR